MNNEETIIMQPQTANKATETTKKEEAPKSEKKENNGKRVAATVAAGVFGGAAGGAASAAAATMLNADEQEDSAEETQEEVVAEVRPASVQETKEEVLVNPEEPDYSGNNGADPIVQPQEEPEPHSVQTSNEEEPEVQVLGVYERTEDGGAHQELAILTDGDEIAAVLDADGDGIADVIGIDHDHNQQFDEGEIYDISEQHIGMEQYEQAYLAQQEEVDQQDTFAYEASDETDYNNDADTYYDA